VSLRSLRFAGLAAALIGMAGCGEAVEEPLPGTNWRATQIAGQPAVAEAMASLAFREDGIAGTTGCNSFHGSATLAEQTLTIGPLATTRMACEPPRMDQEMRFLEALAATRSFARRGSALTFLGEDGAPVMELVQLVD
jgi:heat shock protein HslJ